MVTKMNKFKTFVFLDLETTGLPHLEFNLTKITELCMTACTSDSLISTVLNQLPRVLHKISLCINPFKRIQTKSTEITGLDNYMLEYESQFDENTVKMITHFISRLQQPVCIVAHNGNRFDFPILKKQITNLNMELPPGIKCVDSLKVFRRIDENRIAAENARNEQREIEILAVPLDGFNVSTPEIGSPPKTSANGSETDLKGLLNDNNDWFIANAKEIQLKNEKTPSNRPEKHEKGRNIRFRTVSSDDIKSIERASKSKRALFPESTPSRNKTTPSKALKYNLTAIYERLHGKTPEVSHYAESDTLTLLRCAVATGQEFVKFAEEMAVPFSDIEK